MSDKNTPNTKKEENSLNNLETEISNTESSQNDTATEEAVNKDNKVEISNINIFN